MRTLSVPRLSWRQFDSREAAFFTFAEKCLEGSALVIPSNLNSGRMWRDSWQRLAAMVPRACVGYFIRAGGWSRQRWLRDDERIMLGRIWDHPEFARLQWTVSSEVLQLIHEVFDVVSRMRNDTGYRPEQSDVELYLQELATSESETLHGTAEVISHLLARPLAVLGQNPRVTTWLSEGFGINELTVGALYSSGVDVTPSTIAQSLSRWGWTLPWLGDELAWWWVRADEQRFSGGLDHFAGVLQQLIEVLDAVVSAAESHQRMDYLIPVAQFFKQAYADRLLVTTVEAFVDPLEWMSSGASVRERQLYRDEWGRLLRIARTIGEHRNLVLREHPADREPWANLFLAHVEEHEFAVTLEAVEALRNHLERVVN